MTDAPPDDFRVFRVDTGESSEVRVSRVVTGPWPSVVEALGTVAGSLAAMIVRPGVILHHGFDREVAHALADPGLEGVSWLGLASDGLDLDGNRYDAGNYLEDPADPAPRPLRIAARAEPAILVLSSHELARSGVDPALSSYDEFVHGLLAAERPVLLTSRLRFSAPDRLAPHVVAPDQIAAPGRGVEWLGTVRNSPSIAVVIRTNCDRPALFSRAVAAADAELGRAREDHHELIIASTRPRDDIEVHLAEHVRAETRSTRVVSAPPSTLPGRTAAMLAAIDAARSDYVWFVDDDDWIEPGALDALAAAVHGNDRPLIVGAVTSFEERPDGSLERIRTYLPEEWHRAFTGWNHLPNCALVFPRVVCSERADAVGIHHDLGEDYALQLLALTAPGTSISTTRRRIANVSVRVSGTTVSMADRTPWLRDTGSHMSELSRDPAASAAALWRLGRAIRDLPYPAPTDERPEPPASESLATPDRGRGRFRLRRRRP